MATFVYTAKSADGKTIQGSLDATDQAAASEQLKKRRVIILQLKEKRRGLHLPTLRRKVNLFERMNFTKQLGVMVKAGLPLVESLDLQAQQTGNQYFKDVLFAVKESVRSGTSLADSLAKHREVFGDVYVAMVAAGEKGGQLEPVLTRLGVLLEKEHELIGKIKGAFYYPAFILAVLVAVVIFILIYAIPQLKKIFEEAQVALPVTTRILLAVSDFFAKYFWLIGLIAVVAVFALRPAGKIPFVKHLWDFVQLKMPVFGKLYQKIYLERFSRTLASLIASGIPILDVINTTTQVLTNSFYQSELRSVKSQVERGQPISEALRRQRHFPPIVSNLLAVGEKTGNLASVSEDLADYYAREIDQTTRNLTSLIEPFIMLIMGVGVALVVISVVLPIYRITEAVQ